MKRKNGEGKDEMEMYVREGTGKIKRRKRKEEKKERRKQMRGREHGKRREGKDVKVKGG